MTQASCLKTAFVNIFCDSFKVKFLVSSVKNKGNIQENRKMHGTERTFENQCKMKETGILQQALSTKKDGSFAFVLNSLYEAQIK